MTLSTPAEGDTVALIDGERSFTYEAFERCVDNVAAQLRDDGVVAGRHVAVSLANSAELVVVLHAVLRLGAVWVGIDPNGSIGRRDQILRRLSNPTILNDQGTIEQWMQIDQPFERPDVDDTQPALIAFTSGTSGTSKGVVHSLRSITLPARVSASVEPPHPNERIGTPLSLSTANLMILAPLSAYVRGTTAVVLNRRWAQGFAEDVAMYAVTRTFLVAALIEDLVALVDKAAPVFMPTLDRVIVGGSGARPATLAAFRAAFGVRPTMSYGLSEAPTGVVRESLTDPIGSGRGFALPHISVAIRSHDGDLAPVGELGQICLSAATDGPFANEWTPMLGYLDDPQATASAIVGGELRTGDLGSLDIDGALSVTGRMSDLIIRGGANISPTPLAAAAKSVPAVTDALPLGVEDDRLGERVVVFVESAADVASQVEQALADDGLAFDEVVVVEEMPRNAAK